MTASKPGLDQVDNTTSSRLPPASGNHDSAPHVLHEVAVQEDGTEDPGACIEQMVESKAESGSSLIPADVAVASAENKTLAPDQKN
jgi:hypothetical protein